MSSVRQQQLTCLGYRDSFVDGRDQIFRRLKLNDSRKTAYTYETNHDGDPSDIDVEETVETSDPILSHREPRVCPSLSATPWKDDIMLSYLVDNSRVGGPLSIICHYIAGFNDQLESLQRTATKQSFLALATTLFATAHLQKALLLDGRRLYDQALKSVTGMI